MPLCWSVGGGTPLAGGEGDGGGPFHNAIWRDPQRESVVSRRATTLCKRRDAARRELHSQFRAGPFIEQRSQELPILRRAERHRLQPLPLVGGFRVAYQLEQVGQHRAVAAVVGMPDETGIHFRDVDCVDSRTRRRSCRPIRPPGGSRGTCARRSALRRSTRRRASPGRPRRPAPGPDRGETHRRRCPARVSITSANFGQSAFCSSTISRSAVASARLPMLWATR